MRRPGVAMTISTPRWRSRICGPFGAPPYIAVLRIRELDLTWMSIRIRDSWRRGKLYYPNLVHSCCICTASSRVGASTRAIGPSPGAKRGCLDRYTDIRMTKICMGKKVLAHWYGALQGAQKISSFPNPSEQWRQHLCRWEPLAMPDIEWG